MSWISRIYEENISHFHRLRTNRGELMLRTDEMANDVGSVLYGEDAVALGLMQQVGTLKDALQALYSAIDEDKKQKKE